MLDGIKWDKSAMPKELNLSDLFSAIASIRALDSVADDWKAHVREILEKLRFKMSAEDRIALSEELHKAMGESVKYGIFEESGIAGRAKPDVLPAGSVRDIVDAARAYAMKNYAGKIVTNKSDGTKIEIAKSGIDHSLSKNAGIPNALAATDLENLIVNAEYMGTAPDKANRSGIKSVTFYAANLSSPSGVIPIRIVVREHSDGRKYYDHHVMKAKGPEISGPSGESLDSASICALGATTGSTSLASDTRPLSSNKISIMQKPEQINDSATEYQPGIDTSKAGGTLEKTDEATYSAEFDDLVPKGIVLNTKRQPSDIGYPLSSDPHPDGGEDGASSDQSDANPNPTGDIGGGAPTGALDAVSPLERIKLSGQLSAAIVKMKAATAALAMLDAISPLDRIRLSGQIASAIAALKAAKAPLEKIKAAGDVSKLVASLKEPQTQQPAPEQGGKVDHYVSADNTTVSESREADTVETHNGVTKTPDGNGGYALDFNGDGKPEIWLTPSDDKMAKLGGYSFKVSNADGSLGYAVSVDKYIDTVIKREADKAAQTAARKAAEEKRAADTVAKAAATKAANASADALPSGQYGKIKMDESGGKYTLSFKYDADLVAQVKATGAKWSATARTWTANKGAKINALLTSLRDGEAQAVEQAAQKAQEQAQAVSAVEALHAGAYGDVRLSVSGDQYALSFPYDADMVARIKKFGGKWNPAKKEWTATKSEKLNQWLSALAAQHAEESKKPVANASNGKTLYFPGIMRAPAFNTPIKRGGKWIVYTGEGKTFRKYIDDSMPSIYGHELLGYEFETRPAAYLEWREATPEEVKGAEARESAPVIAPVKLERPEVTPYSKTVEKSFETKNGDSTARFDIQVTRGIAAEKFYADGYNVEGKLKTTARTNITVYVNGKRYDEGNGVMPPIGIAKDSGAFALVGNKTYIGEATAKALQERIKEAEAEAENSDYRALKAHEQGKPLSLTSQAETKGHETQQSEHSKVDDGVSAYNNEESTQKTKDSRMSTNPIYDAIEPMKQESVKRATDFSRKQLTEFAEKIVGTDIMQSAPRPKSTMDRKTYTTMVGKHSLALRLTNWDRANDRPGTPIMAESINHSEIDKLVSQAAQDAASEFDAYVAKLSAKVGPCDSASVDGQLWNGSILTVKKGSETERWSTKQIINVSVLGKLFNQWPTRQMK